MKINNFAKYMKIHDRESQIEFVQLIIDMMLDEKESFEYYKDVLNTIIEDAENYPDGNSTCQAIFQSGMLYGVNGLLNKLRTGDLKFEQIKINKEENVNGRN